MTADKDMGELVVAQGAEVSGVVLLRLHPLRAHVPDVTRILIEQRDQLAGHFVVVAQGRVRVRPLHR